jgi:mono/diheme cytochrome c family protein
MQYRSLGALAAAALVLAACGGGSSPNDVRTNADPPSAGPITGPDRFLLFPNPQMLADGSFQTNTAAYPQAYYEAIDPTNARDTLAKWKATNGFDTGTGEQVTVVFGDTRDLGYGRRMNARRNPDGTLAFFVENYLVRTTVDYAYSNLNLEAAIVRDAAHFIGVNAIEFSPGPNGGVPFAKWYNFNSVTGLRAAQVDLDGRGTKAMPGPCISCHGGRGEALTPANAAGKQLFNLIRFSESRSRGDVEGHMHPFDVDAFGFSTYPGFSRSEQEAAIKTINKWILCTYPLPTPSTAPEDQCRRAANRSEWQGTAAALIKAYYGGDGLPSAVFDDRFVPDGWLTAGQSTLYLDVIKPSCRTCHVMRGSGGNSDQDFMTYAKFVGYSDRVKAHINDRGNMPLAKIVFDAFYRGVGPDRVATFLSGQGFSVRDAAGAPLQPGRPLADPGPSRAVAPGTTRLSGSNSLYASTYAWTIVSGPPGATLTDATSAQPTFTANTAGSYVLQLVTTGNNATSLPTQFTIVVKAGLTPAPSAIRFADIKNVLQTAGCTNCHSPTGSLPRPPLFYTNEDRNEDGTVGDATDDLWYAAEVRSRINFTEIAASPILRKPSGNHHGGALQPGFDATKAPGEPERANLDLFLNWILNGAP